MSIPAYVLEPQVLYLSQLLDDIVRGNILIPRFQRGFVWTDDQRLDLLRSVNSGIPLGSILVWRTTKVRLDTFDRIGGYRVPPSPEPTPGVPRQYLLDGHQRLSTLFGALHQNDTALEPVLDLHDAGSGVDWAVFFDLEEDDFLIQRGKHPKRTWIPTRSLLDSLALLRFQRGLAQLSDADKMINRSDRLAAAFRNYKIPLVPIVTDNLEDATKAFQRINSSGTQMSDVHMVIALTYGSGFDLADVLQKAEEQLAEVGWGDFDERFILATVRASLDLRISNPDAEQTSKAVKKNPSVVDRAAKSLVLAARFLREHCGIGSPELIPYSYQAVIIADAFRLNPKPSHAVLSALSAWLWRTTYTAYFLGARDKDVTRALVEVREIVATEAIATWSRSDQVDPIPKRYDFRSARTKAFVLRLAELNPLIPGGPSYDAVETLARQGHNAVLALLHPNPKRKIDVSAPENRFLVPPEASVSFRSELEVASPDDSAFLSSHAISLEALSAWRARDFARFLKERRSTLLAIEMSFVRDLGLDYRSD